MSSDSKLLKTKKDYPLADYKRYKLAQSITFGLTKDEGLELNKKGFVSIDSNHKGYGTLIKLFDTTNYAVAYCNYCKEDQPVSFTGHESTYKGALNNGIFVWCDECKHLLFCLDHIANGGAIS